jgi:type VI secretion system protein ImpA
MGARWDGQDLLHPISVEKPCGEDLEDTPLLASFDTFRLFGQLTPPDPPPEWGDVRSRALEALRRSKDIRLLAYLGAASLRTDGLPAFAETLTVASQWLETYWLNAYPLIDEDAVLRRNALNCFSDPIAVIDGLRRTPLVTSRQHGRLSLRDVEIAAGQLQPLDGEPRPDETQINAAFAELPLADLQALEQSASSALAALKGIIGAMAGAGPEAAPDFDPLSAQLNRLNRVLRAQLEMRGAPAGDDAPSEPIGSAAGALGAIRSRQDAIRALDAVAEFFRRNEPSSPIPLFIDRAKRLVSKNFLEVLADVAPEALPHARAAGGLPQGDQGT